MQPGIVVRRGDGHPRMDGTFTDEICRIERNPRQHRGWQSVRYKGRRYRLGGGCYVEWFICLDNPIPTKAEQAEREAKRIKQMLA